MDLSHTVSEIDGAFGS